MDSPLPSTVSKLVQSSCITPSAQQAATWSYDTSFLSSCQLEQCFARLGKTVTVVQLSPGPLAGRFSVVHLHGLSVLMLSTNKVLLVNGERGNDCVSFSLEISGNVDDHRVQCQAFERHALYGFNQKLQEAHFQLSAGSICLMAITTASTFNTLLTRLGHDHLIAPMMSSNCLPLDGETHAALGKQLSTVFSKLPRTPKQRRLAAESILMQLIACLQSGVETFKPFGLSSRDSLVQEFIRWGFEHGTSPATLDEICQQLYTSRRTLILGSKENFNCGPMELLRTIRLQQVHALLRSPAARSAAGLQQVSDVAEFCGFRSRGHFARAYQEHFEETPKATLMKSVA